MSPNTHRSARALANTSIPMEDGGLLLQQMRTGVQAHRWANSLNCGLCYLQSNYKYLSRRESQHSKSMSEKRLRGSAAHSHRPC